MAQNSFKILDVPENATANEIKTRYRQLVRFFHPDNFETSSDRAFAENKLKEINAAYNSLVRAKAAAFPPNRPGLLPEPVIFPMALDFGWLPRNSSLQEMVYILNIGEEVEKFDIVYNQSNPWFKVSQSRQLEAKKPFPMALTITVDTSTLRRGKSYQEWISIVMDSVVTRVPVSVHVPWLKFLAGLPLRLISLLLIAGFLFGTVSSLGVLYSLSGFYSDRMVDQRATFAAAITPTVALPVAQSAVPAITLSTAGKETNEFAILSAVEEPTVDGTDSGVALSSMPISQTVAMTATTPISDSAGSNNANSNVDTPLLPTPIAPTAEAVVLLPTALPSATAIATNIPLPPPTATVLPPTEPPPPLPTATSQPATAFMVVPDTYSVNARAGTSTEHAILQELPAGTILPAIGRNSDSTWIYIRLSDGRLAWAFIDVIVINRDLLAQLPVVQ